MATTIGIVSLAYCAGCEVALASTERFCELLSNDAIRIGYSTLLVDADKLESVDVLLVTGSIRTREDVAAVKEASRRALKVVAFGSCACYGGLPGLANTIDRKEMIGGVFGSVEPTVTGARPELTRFVVPIEE
ncbi:MAG: hypothetical protein RMI45_03870, partial [Ignisphaera sp.]|nr:hypothetical protein [Ignisphaera sp.]MDW8085363.1 hypothetical protein [Ignisphaera sp.]